MADLDTHKEIRRASLKDHDLMEDKANLTHDETVKLTELTEEELAIEKKLKRRIDFTIMPLVVLVYLMNYIDSECIERRLWQNPNLSQETTMPPLVCKVWRRISTSKPRNTRQLYPSSLSATSLDKCRQICCSTISGDLPCT